MSERKLKALFQSLDSRLKNEWISNGDFFMARKEFRGRTATVYLPDGEILTNWHQEAARGGATISEYIFEMVEKSRRPAEDVVRPDLVRENSDLKTLNRKLEQEVNLLYKNEPGDHAGRGLRAAVCRL
jgi:hypothetical protein